MIQASLIYYLIYYLYQEHFVIDTCYDDKLDELLGVIANWLDTRRITVCIIGPLPTPGALIASILMMLSCSLLRLLLGDQVKCRSYNNM